jgi:hypothetical protein
MGNGTDKQKEDRAPPKAGGHFWDDPVYRYVSRRHRAALAAGDGAEAARFDGLMQQLANGSMPDELHQQLEAEAKADRQQRKHERKRRQRSRPTRRPTVEPASSVNVAELKRRIYNPHVSRENVIKALEALPAAERSATIAGLPPGLRRKLGGYLKDKGR